jgi:SAM-dependent methyltransferase
MNMETDKPQLAIVKSCEGDLLEHGDNFRGVGWTKKKEYADLRYQVMLDLLRENDPVTLLDVGCGAAHLLEYMRRHRYDHVEYSGLDLSQAFLDLSRGKFTDITFYREDILANNEPIPKHDYVVMNGLFNWRGESSHEEMWAYCQAMIKRAFNLARVGIAFNVMSKYVDWEREDLFHLPFETLASFLDREVSRHFTFRHDYGLFEYTAYVYRKPLCDLV